MSPLARPSARHARALLRGVHQRFFAPEPATFRAVRAKLRLTLEVLLAATLLAFVLGRGNGAWAAFASDLSGPFFAAALLVLAVGYVHEVGAARRYLREAVSAEGSGGAYELSSFSPLTLRGRSLFALGSAFGAALAGEPSRAEAALREIQREDLGPWEGRVFEATRTLVALARGEAKQAARIAPLALATGHDDVDRTVALALVRGAWKDPVRLAAIRRALDLGGPEAVRLAVLARLRVNVLEGPEGIVENAALTGLGELSPASLHDASEDAHAVGDADLAEQLRRAAESRGAYRLPRSEGPGIFPRRTNSRRLG